MLYPRCPTCNKLFADKQIEYEEKSDIINNNMSTSSKEKKDAISQLIKDLGFVKACCNMRIISYIREENIIVSV
jgi:DNA-directed RNA polymerase subunit N (RpoN/RPB10)